MEGAGHLPSMGVLYQRRIRPAVIEITCNVIQNRLSDFLILPQPVHLLHVFVLPAALVA